MGERKPYLAVILIQAIYAGMFLLSKAAFDGGMNSFVFVFYRQAAATLFLLPLALFFEWFLFYIRLFRSRNGFFLLCFITIMVVLIFLLLYFRRTAPQLSFVTFCKIFMLSFCGITLSLNIYGIAIVFTSATLASATANCLPVITFFLALLLRTEVLKLRTTAGKAKLVGVLVCLGGAATLAFYKGPHFKFLCIHHVFGRHHGQQLHGGHVSSGKTWIKDVFLLLVSNIFWGLWLVLQVRILKSYPSKLLLTTLQCFLSSIQSFAIAIAVERDPFEWRLGWNVRLLAVAYCGIVVTGVTYYMQTWVVEKKGPVFLAMSTPLAMIFTTLCSAILLCEMINLGSVLGGLLLVIGLYSVLWGKTKESKEQKANDENGLADIEAVKDCSELKQVDPAVAKAQSPV